MHHPVTAHAPREAAVNVLLANHASPVRLARLQSRSSPQINKSLRRGPFSAARALGMRPHPVNMHALLVRPMIVPVIYFVLQVLRAKQANLSSAEQVLKQQLRHVPFHAKMV